MEIMKLIPVLTCEKCKKPMAPMLYMDLNDRMSCCPTPGAPVGKTNYKCPGCGGSRDIQHVHK